MDKLGIFGKPKAINQVVLLGVTDIVPNPSQPRRQFDPRALRELADSINENGLLQPITVRQIDDGYELIAGERRLIACRMLGKEKVPAIVEQASDDESAIFALLENLQRKDLNYFEQAAGLQLLMQRCGLTQEQLAKKLGKAQPTIANKLRLLNFSDPLQQKILDCGLTERHARALLRLPSEQMAEFALEQIVKERMNVGETEGYIDALLTPALKPENEEKRPKPTRLFVVKDMRVFLNTISKAVSTMKLAGIEIDTCKQEDEEFIHFTMKIPKKGVYRSHSA